MGIFRVPLQVGNPFTGQTEIVEAVVDTGAVDSVMPASLLQRLGIEPMQTVRFRTVSGERVDYEVGSAYFSAEGFRCIANVVFGPEEEPLMGATTLEQLYLAVDSRNERLTPIEGLLL